MAVKALDKQGNQDAMLFIDSQRADKERNVDEGQRSALRKTQWRNDDTHGVSGVSEVSINRPLVVRLEERPLLADLQEGNTIDACPSYRTYIPNM